MWKPQGLSVAGRGVGCGTGLVCVHCAVPWGRQGMPSWAVQHQGARDHVICREGGTYIPNGLGVLPPWDRASDPQGPPSFLPLAFLRGEKLGFLLRREGAARPAAVGASSDSAGWGVFMSSRNGCKSGTSVHLWPGHPLPYGPLP